MEPRVDEPELSAGPTLPMRALERRPVRWAVEKRERENRVLLLNRRCEDRIQSHRLNKI